MKKQDKTLTSSLENYLKAIYIIVKKNQAARVKDVANFLGIGASSVSEALKTLASNGYINYQPYGIITLTKLGDKSAEKLCERHKIISDFLSNVLMVDEKDLELGTKSIEHGINQNILDKFVSFLTFMQTCACKEPKWIKSYKFFASNGNITEKCTNCIKDSKKAPELKCGADCCSKHN